MGFLDDYEPVEDRLQAFYHDNPAGRVITVLLEHADGQYVVRAEVFRQGEDWPAASGLAEERDGSSKVNQTNALENCETSAIGRALANLGYAAKGKRPSREEMSKTSASGQARATGVSPEPASGRAPGADPSSPAPGPATTAGAGTSEPPPTAAPQAGDTSSPTAIGEGAAATGPGETTTDSPGPPHYDFDPAACDHRRTTGSRGLLTPRKSPRGPVCPRCGLSYITVKESTNADLGAA